MPHVYIVRCADDSFYVGSTWQLELRIWQHNEGLGGRFTARRRPVELVYSSFHESVAEAYAHERRIHGWSRAKKQALIDGDYPRLQRLARGRQQTGGTNPPASHEGN